MLLAAMVQAAMVEGKVQIDGSETLPAEAALVSAATVSGSGIISGEVDRPASVDSASP